MSFFARDDEVFLLLAAPGSPGLWQAEQWRPFAAAIDPVVAQARAGKSGVRTHQYNPQGKLIPFGRMGWDTKSHAKWTHTADTAGARFMRLEAWAPTWTVCEKDDLAPDLFISLFNEAHLTAAGRPLLFGQRLVCAVATELGEEACATLKQALAQLALQQQAPVLAHARRPWGKAMLGGFGSAIQDLALTDLFKPGNPHARPLDAETFRGHWNRIALTTADGAPAVPPDGAPGPAGRS